MGERDIRYKFADFCRVSLLPVPFFIKTMVNNINNFGVINFYESNSYNAQPKRTAAELITPVEVPETPDSIIFTKKAKKEGKIPTIIEALQKSIIGRNDKTRALVQELQSWQKEDYIDRNYNARVMYDELDKLMSVPFGYDTFRKEYNHL